MSWQDERARTTLAEGTRVINPVRLFLSFRGRIGRRAYWLGLIVLVAVSPFSFSTVLSQNPFEDALGAIQSLGWIGALWTLALFIPLAALNTKRLHDLGQSGIFAVLFYAPAALATAELFLGKSAWMDQFNQYATYVVALAGVAGIWFLFRLGFIGGSAGANKYGPEPGAATPIPRRA